MIPNVVETLDGHDIVDKRVGGGNVKERRIHTKKVYVKKAHDVAGQRKAKGIREVCLVKLA